MKQAKRVQSLCRRRKGIPVHKVAAWILSLTWSLLAQSQEAFLYFDGRDDEVTIPDNAVLDVTRAITVEAWIRPDSISSTKAQNRVVSKGIDWELTISTGDTGTSYGTSGDVQWRATISGKNARIGGGTLRLGSWHHLAGTYDGSTFSLYVDGRLVAQAQRTGRLAFNSLPLCVGDYHSLDRYFHGGIDEVRIWNYARSESQIRQAMDRELSGTEPGLIAYFPLNRGEDQVVLDHSPYENHGVLGTSTRQESSDPQWVVTRPPNSPPVVDAGEDTTVTLPENQVLLSGTAQDDGLPAGTLSVLWSLESGPAQVTFSDPTSLTTTCTFTTAGTYVIRLTCDDSELSASDTLTVVVLPPADTTPPTVTITAPQQAEVVAGVVLISAQVTDQGGVASVLVRVDGTTLAALTSPPFETLWDTQSEANGPHTIAVSATDTAGNQATQSITVVVENAPPNSPPVVDAGEDTTVTLPENQVLLSGTAQDDGLPAGTLSVLWSLESGPAQVTFSDPTSLTTTCTFTTAGTYVIRLTCDDSELSASDTLTVVVLPPASLARIEIVPPEVSLAPGAVQVFWARGFDTGGNEVILQPVWSASGGTIDPQRGFYRAPDVPGQYFVQATAGDLTASAPVSVTPPGTEPRRTYLSFDGINDEVRVPDRSWLDLREAITVEAWIRPLSISSTKAQNRVVSKSIDWELTISTGDTGTSYGTRGDVQWRATIGGKNARIGGGTLTAGQWHHVAGTFDGITFALYVDGRMVAEAKRMGSLATNAKVLCIGDYYGLDRHFHGAIDEVRIWNYARSQSQIRQAMYRSLTGTEEGLVAYLPFDEGSGQVVYDHSTFSNHGLLGTQEAEDVADPTWIAEPPVNQPPSVEAQWYQVAGAAGNEVLLVATAQDDGLPSGTLSFLWSLQSGPAQVTFADPTGASTVCSIPVPGTYVLGVTASDGEFSTSDSVLVVVDGSLSPSVENLSCAFDASSESIVASWSLPPGAQYQSITILRNGNPVAELPGTAESYEESNPQSGTFLFAVIGNGAKGSAPVSCTVEVPVLAPAAGLTLTPDLQNQELELRWANGEPYDTIIVVWGQREVVALPGITTQYSLQCAPAGIHRIGIRGRKGSRSSPVTWAVREGAHVDWDPPAGGPEPQGYYIYVWQKGNTPPLPHRPSQVVSPVLTVSLKELFQAGVLPDTDTPVDFYLSVASFAPGGVSEPAGPVEFTWQVVK